MQPSYIACAMQGMTSQKRPRAGVASRTGSSPPVKGFDYLLTQPQVSINFWAPLTMYGKLAVATATAIGWLLSSSVMKADIPGTFYRYRSPKAGATGCRWLGWIFSQRTWCKSSRFLVLPLAPGRAIGLGFW